MKLKSEDDIKTEEQEQRPEASSEREALESQQTEECKTEPDRHSHHGHKRRYDEAHGNSHYDHREDKR